MLRDPCGWAPRAVLFAQAGADGRPRRGHARRSAGRYAGVLGEAFVLEGGVQCGFCIPGIVVRASSMLRQGCTDDREAVKQGLVGHLCRCTGYARIVDAIQTAGDAWKNGGELPRKEPRRHSYFGEDFGLSRNPDYAKTKNGNGNGNGKRNGNGFGIGDSPSRYRGFEQALGERPFVDDMSVPGMLHGGMVLSEHPRAIVARRRTSSTHNRPLSASAQRTGWRRGAIIALDRAAQTRVCVVGLPGTSNERQREQLFWALPTCTSRTRIAASLRSRGVGQVAAVARYFLNCLDPKENGRGNHRGSHQAHGRGRRTAAGVLLDHVRRLLRDPRPENHRRHQRPVRGHAQPQAHRPLPGNAATRIIFAPPIATIAAAG